MYCIQEVHVLYTGGTCTVYRRYMYCIQKVHVLYYISICTVWEIRTCTVLYKLYSTVQDVYSTVQVHPVLYYISIPYRMYTCCV